MVDGGHATRATRHAASRDRAENILSGPSRALVRPAQIVVFTRELPGLTLRTMSAVSELGNKHPVSLNVSQWMCIPFAMMNPIVGSLKDVEHDWIGHVDGKDIPSYIDYGLLLIFGGIPWQVYFQRVLSSKTASRAQMLSYVAAIGCFLMAIPPVMIGAIAKATRKLLQFVPFSMTRDSFPRRIAGCCGCPPQRGTRPPTGGRGR